MTGIKCIVDGSYGRYVPQAFAMQYIAMDWQISYEDEKILLDVDHEQHLEVWTEVLDNASYTDEKNNVWRLLQESDLYAYCLELMTDEEKETFGFID